MEETPNGVNDSPQLPQESVEIVDTSQLQQTGCAGGQKCCRLRDNLRCTNWLADIPGGAASYDIVEVHFKNTR